MAMEKVAKAKNKFLMLLPKAASAVVTFQNPPFSPSREKRLLENPNKPKTHFGKGHSGPMRSIIPAEARRKSKNSIFEAQNQEPTSPKISCMGQIKHKHNPNPSTSPKNKKIVKKTNKSLSMPKNIKPIISTTAPREESKKKEKKKKKQSAIGKIFGGGGAKQGRKSDVGGEGRVSVERAPSLSQMKRFASSRDRFTNFDWTAQIAPVESDHDHDHQGDYYSDEERGQSEGEEEEDGVVSIPFSAPILVNRTNGCGGGGGERVAMEPRKEINLWKRRTMPRPMPLQLNPLFIS